MDLGVAGIGKKGPTPCSAPGSGDVAAHRIGREEKYVPVAASGKDDSICRVGGDLASVEVADDDALSVAVDEDHVQHLGARIHRHAALVNFLFECLIATDEKLLPSLAASIECAGNLRAAERAVVEQTTIFAGEGNALGDALVNDGIRNLSEAIDVTFSGAEVAALDRVVK